MTQIECWGTVQQPILFPPIYMMERFARCDKVVIFDNAQFDRDNLQFKLMTELRPVMIGVQVTGAEHFVHFKDRHMYRLDTWARKVLNSAQMIYGRSPYYKTLKPWFEDTVHQMILCEKVTDFCLVGLKQVFGALKLPIPLYMSSNVLLNRPLDPTQTLAELCNQLQITDYIQGAKSMREYFTYGPFEALGIRTWGQLFTVEYQSNKRTANATFSILDAMFSLGVAETRDMIMQRKPEGVVLITRHGGLNGQGFGNSAACG